MYLRLHHNRLRWSGIAVPALTNRQTFSICRLISVAQSSTVKQLKKKKTENKKDLKWKERISLSENITSTYCTPNKPNIAALHTIRDFPK